MSEPETFVVHVQPRAARTEIVGRHGDAIKIRLRSPPVDGAANDELTRFLARRLSVARREVRIVGGTSQRRKRIAVTGLSAQQVARKLLGEESDPPNRG